MSGRRCWIVTDGAAGNVKQCEALAARLDVEVESLLVTLRAPWSWLAPRLRVGGRWALAGDLAGRLDGPLPDLVIGAGRRAALAALLVRRASGGRCFAVQILDPRIDPGHFDLVVCPRHDDLTGPNVLRTIGALHDVDAERLAAWRDRWRSRLGDLPGPRVALLIGGPTRAVPLGNELLDRFVEAAERVAGSEGTLLVTTSRRTPAALASALRDRFRGRAVLAEEEPENPYPGFLAWAQHIFVTPDSVNMLSEALGADAAVYSELPPVARPRIRRFHETLRAEGLLRGLDDGPAQPAATPLREAGAVAAEVLARWGSTMER